MNLTKTYVDHQIYILYKYIMVLCSKITQIALHLFDAKREHLFQSETSIGQYIYISGETCSAALITHNFIRFVQK